MSFFEDLLSDKRKLKRILDPNGFLTTRQTRKEIELFIAAVDRSDHDRIENYKLFEKERQKVYELEKKNKDLEQKIIEMKKILV
jgi:hypothetical protein